MADEKKKATRTVKPVYAVMSVKDNEGNAMDVDRENVTVHGVYKNADELLGVLEGAGLPAGSFYKRIALGT